MSQQEQVAERVRVHLENAHDAAEALNDRGIRLDVTRCVDEAMEWLEPARATEPVDGSET